MAGIYSAPAVTVTTENKWFKKGDVVTVAGLLAKAPGATITSFEMTGVGSTPIAIPWDAQGNWSYTYTGSDTSGSLLTFKATDSAGQSGTAKYTLKVDATDPVISCNATAGYQSGLVTWYKQGTAASISASATDVTSGVQAMTKDGETYTPGISSMLDTAEEGETECVLFEAADVAGNTSTLEFYYDVDGTAPIIARGGFSGDSMYVDRFGKVWFKQNDSSAVYNAVVADAKSGLKLATFNGIAGNQGTFALDTTEKGSVTSCVSAIDNVGNFAFGDEETYWVDGLAPVITVAQDPVAEHGYFAVSVSANAVDLGSGIRSFQYRIDGGELQDYTGSITVDNTTVFTFVAYDNVGFKSEVTYVMTRAADPIIIDGFTAVDRISEDRTPITILNGGALYVTESAELAIDTLTLASKALLKNDGDFDAYFLNVIGNGNVITGNVFTIDRANLAENAELTVNRYQYENMLACTDFVENKGTLIVTPVSGMALCVDDVYAVIAKPNLPCVHFMQDMIDIRKLTFKKKTVVAIGAENIYGTSGNDTIQFNSNSVISFGTAGYSINLQGGSNKIKIEKNASTTILADIVNVSSISISTGDVVSLADVAFAAGRSGKLQLSSSSSVTVSSIYGSDKTTQIVVGKDSFFAADAVSFYSKSAQIQLSSRAAAEFGAITGLTKLSVSQGSYSKKTGVTTYTALNAESLTGTAKSNTFSIGNYADVNISGLIDFAGGKDTLKVGSDSVVVLKADLVGMNGLSKFTLGKNTDAYLSSELLAFYEAKTKASTIAKNNVDLFDIGSAEIAQYFTDIDDEKSDDVLTAARTLETMDYTGWLCGEDDLDLTDCFARGAANSVTRIPTGEDEGALLFSQYDAYGNQLGDTVLFDQTVAFAADAASFAVTLADENSPAISYRMLLA